MAIVSSRLSAARSLLQRHNLYGSPPRHSFYSCASSRALLHVGSLSLWDRQPSNAPPLLLSPAGLASRREPHTKTRLGLCPKTPYPLSCGWIRIGFFSYRRKINPYGAADTLSRCLRRILFWFLQTDSRKSRCRDYGLDKQLFAQTAPPPLRGRGTGVRSRAPPVADAARRSTRSGRKNRASEQREDFIGHRKADGADAPAAPYKHRLAYAPEGR